MSDYFANGYFAPKYWTVKYFQGGEVNPNAMSASLSGGGSITAVLVGIEVVTATGTSAGSYNMYRVDDPEPKKPKPRKVKYLGPAPQKLVAKTPRTPKASTKIPAYLADFEKGKLAARQSRGAKLRAMQLADDEWLMLN